MLVDLLLVEGKISYTYVHVPKLCRPTTRTDRMYPTAVMSCDRFIAICNSLCYPVIMSWKRCQNITAFIWVVSFLSNTLSNPGTFCRDNQINHFACELLALIQLACGDTSFYKTAVFYQSLFTILVPFSFIVVLKIHSVDGRTIFYLHFPSIGCGAFLWNMYHHVFRIISQF